VRVWVGRMLKGGEKGSISMCLAEILARWLMKRYTLGSILAYNCCDCILLINPTAVWVKKALSVSDAPDLDVEEQSSNPT